MCIRDRGAIENAKLVKKYYHGWQAWFYVSNQIEKSVIYDLKKEGAHVIIKESKTASMEGLIWRFLAISDLNVDLMIVRDCDSRITNREAMAVNQWLDSHKTFHIMKDHPFHRMLIMGGMWGCRKPLNFDIKELFSEAKSMGYDPTVMRKILALRKMDIDERLEKEALLKTYKNSLGIYQ